MKLTKLNELQIPTWHWLGMNEAQMDIDASLGTAYRGGVLSGADHVEICRQGDRIQVENLPRDLERLRDFAFEHQNYSLSLTIPRDVQCDEPIVLDFLLDEESPVLVDHLRIHAQAGSRADVVVRYRSAGEGAYFHSGFATLRAEEGAQVRLIKIQMLGQRDAHLDGTAVQVEAGGEGRALFCELGGGQVVAGCNISLAGKKSRGGLDTLYLGSGGRTQDFNYRLELRGSASEGELVVRGALAGKAKKTLKSTLDFIRGASGSRGVEEETVLTLSSRAVNLSTPLLLCGEDNVEGAHATSSGKPDPGKLYYLMSRGFTLKEAKRLLVEASFTPILNKLPSPGLRDAVQQQIQEVIHDEH
ncbi:Fe-S cluster assembly scaffold protein SufB [Anaerotaenia torta]|uniref:SufD family Fe-S cluster assembly protein n=1 Tax=Anaerotaenia torta TaxID=433293 RepID=UPI003D19800B